MSTAVETLKGDKEWSDSERETGMAQLWGRNQRHSKEEEQRARAALPYDMSRDSEESGQPNHEVV